MDPAPPKFITKRFFDEKVRPHFRDLEALQLRVKQFSFGSVLSSLLFLGTVSGVLGLAAPLGFLFLVPGAGCLLGAFLKAKELREKFKDVVVGNLVRALYPSFEYHSTQYISESVYAESGLFPRKYDKYQGDDLVVGKVGSTDLAFSELHTQYKSESVDSKGRRNTKWVTIFRGIFFHADFHKEFQGATYVLPDRAESFFGKWIGQGIQSVFSRHGEIVKLENPEFEKRFVTYSKDQQEARYLLSPSLMEKVLLLRGALGVELSLAFVRGRIFVAISTRRSHFEPRWWGKVVSLKEIAAMRDLIDSVIGIVDQLNLNQRVWTK